MEENSQVPFIIPHVTFGDNRGNFCGAPLDMSNDKRLDKKWVQVNTSISIESHTIRGLHYQITPFEQAKYLKVVHGKIKSMILCIDRTNSNFANTFTFEVDKDHAVMVPRGYANGLITLEPNTVIQYFVDNPYYKKGERSILYSSVKEFDSLVQEITDTPILSEKDMNGIDFDLQLDFSC